MRADRGAAARPRHRQRSSPLPPGVSAPPSAPSSAQGCGRPTDSFPPPPRWCCWLWLLQQPSHHGRPRRGRGSRQQASFSRCPVGQQLDPQLAARPHTHGLSFFFQQSRRQKQAHRLGRGATYASAIHCANSICTGVSTGSGRARRRIALVGTGEVAAARTTTPCNSWRPKGAQMRCPGCTRPWSSAGRW